MYGEQPWISKSFTGQVANSFVVTFPNQDFITFTNFLGSFKLLLLLENRTQVQPFDDRSKIIQEQSKNQLVSLGFGFSGLSSGNMLFFKQTGQLRGKLMIVLAFQSKFAEGSMFISNFSKSIMKYFQASYTSLMREILFQSTSHKL